MYLMYVDESGDCGLKGSQTDYFVLAGLVVHERQWQPYLEQLIAFRRNIRQQFGLKLREELHASAMINKPGDLARIKRYDRLSVIRLFADALASMTDLNLICVVVDKRNKPFSYNVFDNAWKTLLQRFENTLLSGNFRGPQNTDDRGIVLPDHTDDKKLAQLLRRMRRYNPVPNRQGFGLGYRNLTIQRIIEDPWFKDSEHSYFTQAVDLAAYLLYQHLAPNAYMRRKSGQNYFKRLAPIYCTVASTSDPRGIVFL